MEIVATLFGWLFSALLFVLGIVWWIVSYVVWGLIWLLLPLALLMFVALRASEKVFGAEVVRAWVKARAMRYGSGSWERIRPWLFALGVAPFRVLAWFLIYALMHALVSLAWKPKWSPWQRAWAKRFKKVPASKRPRRAPVKGATK